LARLKPGDPGRLVESLIGAAAAAATAIWCDPFAFASRQLLQSSRNQLPGFHNHSDR